MDSSTEPEPIYRLTTSSGQIRPYALRTFVLPSPSSSVDDASLDPTTVIPSLLSPTHLAHLTPLPRPVPTNPIPDPPYEFLAIPSKGLGLFATRPIARGELIAWERPGVIVPSLRLSQTGEEDVYEALANAFFSCHHHSAAVRRHDALRQMAIAPQYRQMHWLKGVLRTNATFLDFGFKDGEEMYGGIFPLINKCNHSCTPNASTHFLPRTDAAQSGYNLLILVLSALRDILPGEEITKSYVDPLLPRAKRRRVLLENYGFDCDCDACSSSSSSDSDSSAADRKREETLARLLTPTFSKWLLLPPSPSPSLLPLLPSSSLEFLLATHTKTLELLTHPDLSIHAPRLLIEEELAWACAAEGDKDGFGRWAGKVVDALRWVRELGLEWDGHHHLPLDSKGRPRANKKKRWKGRESMPPASGLDGYSTWTWYVQDAEGRVPCWGWRRREREYVEEQILKGKSPGVDVEEGLLNTMFTVREPQCC